MNPQIDYRDIFQFTSNGVIVTDAQGVITHINRRSKKYLQIDASNILILGESGTGKGLLAKLIHKNSIRNKNPFVENVCFF